MKMLKSLLLSAGAVAFALPAMASAPSFYSAGNSVSGSAGDFVWEAKSLIVGMTPTRAAAPPPPTHVGGGSAIFFPNYSTDKGIASLIMDYGVFTSGPNVGLAARFICTGSAFTKTQIVTAAHCVSGRTDTSSALPTTTAFFHDGSLGDVRVPFNPGVTAIVASSQAINPGYSGAVIDHNDVAVITLSAGVPKWVNIYDLLLNVDDLTGVEFNVKGYGNRSIPGGGGPTGGATAGTTGYLRQGLNIYDYRMGDPIFSQIPGSGWDTIFLPATNPNIAYSYLSDFDSGLAVNDQSCRVAQAANLAQAAGAIFCQTGVGEREVSTAGGDSGGPGFVDGRIATVTSYGLTFGTAWGDCRAGLQSSCGELNGFVPLYIHKAWLASLTVPEPGTWAMLIAGFGMVGAAARRRRDTAVTA